MNTNEFLNHLRSNCGENVTETPVTTNLTLSKHDFVDKMLKEENGKALLDLLEDGEWRVVERLGLCHGYQNRREVVFEVPRWNNLVAHLKIVHNVFSKEDGAE